MIHFLAPKEKKTRPNEINLLATSAASTLSSLARAVLVVAAALASRLVGASYLFSLGLGTRVTSTLTWSAWAVGGASSTVAGRLFGSRDLLHV